jgi:hypothetical protein
MALVGELFIELTRATLLHHILCVCSLANLAQAERKNLMTHIIFQSSDGQKPHIDLGFAPTLTRGFVGQHRRNAFLDEKQKSIPYPLNFMEMSDMKRTESNDNTASNTIQQPKARSTDQERDLGHVVDDENDVPLGPDHLVVDHGVDSDGDNDDEINNDVTSPNNSGAGNDRVSNDGMPPIPRG